MRALVTRNTSYKAMIRHAQIIYPIYMELSTRFHLGLPLCGELESSPAQQPDEGALRQVERWFRHADTQIEVHHLRELLSQITLAGDAFELLLAWHFNKEPKDKSDRDKIDFFLVQYLAERLPINVPTQRLSFEQVADLLKPVLGETIWPKRLPLLEDCIRDLEKCLTLGDFIEHSILERGQSLKAVAHQGPFDPAKLVAFTHFSFLLRLSSIRALQEDLRALEEDLKDLEKSGVREVVGISAGASEKQSTGQVRKLCDKWKQYFPGKYTQTEWFIEVIRLRSAVKQALQRSTSEPDTKSTQAFATKTTKQEPRLQSEVERYMHEIASQVQSPLGGRATSVTAIDLAGVRLMLSTGEVDAFQEACEGMNLVVQHAVAVRAVLLAALTNVTDRQAAVKLAESEALVLQEQITVTKEAGDMEAAVNLTACYRSLRKLLEKMDKALPLCRGESLRLPPVQPPNSRARS
jgi:hypothetical protein